MTTELTNILRDLRRGLFPDTEAVNKMLDKAIALVEQIPPSITVSELMEMVKQWGFDNWECFKDVEGLKSWTRSAPGENTLMEDFRARLSSMLAETNHDLEPMQFPDRTWVCRTQGITKISVQS